MTLDEEIVVFHYQLGIAISEWSTVEDRLRHALVLCFTADRLNRESLSIGIFSLESFRAKLKFVDGVVSRKLAGASQIEPWKLLCKKADALSTTRNKLAHWPLSKYPSMKPGMRVVLAPWVFRKRHGVANGPPEGSLRVNDIARSHAEFKALTAMFDCFLTQPESPDFASHIRSARGRSAAQIASEIREVFKKHGAGDGPGSRAAGRR